MHSQCHIWESVRTLDDKPLLLSLYHLAFGSLFIWLRRSQEYYQSSLRAYYDQYNHYNGNYSTYTRYSQMKWGKSRMEYTSLWIILKWKIDSTEASREGHMLIKGTSCWHGFKWSTGDRSQLLSIKFSTVYKVHKFPNIELHAPPQTIIGT